jgi:hypothetical protein
MILINILLSAITSIIVALITTLISTYFFNRAKKFRVLVDQLSVLIASKNFGNEFDNLLRQISRLDKIASNLIIEYQTKTDVSPNGYSLEDYDNYLVGNSESLNVHLQERINSKLLCKLY